MKYLVITLRTDEFDFEIIDQHYEFLDILKQQRKLEMAGPFTDKTGGAYVILADNKDEAEKIAFQDPLYLSKSSSVIVYEWQIRS